MYHELVKVLRETDFSDGCPCGAEPLCEGKDCVILQAADAIEELSKKRDTACWGCKCNKIERNEWIPITERLPDSDEDMLVTDGDACAVGYYRPDANAWDSCEFGWIENRPDPFPQGLGTVTHWMPLPQLPKDGES